MAVKRLFIPPFRLAFLHITCRLRNALPTLTIIPYIYLYLLASQIAYPQEEPEDQYFSTFNGSTTLRYRVQRLEGNKSDQDIFQDLSLSLGNPEKDRLTWRFYGSLREDIDGINPNTITKEKFKRLIFPRTPVEDDPVVTNSPFFSIDDSIAKGIVARPYEFYAEIKDVNFIDNVRAGRQYMPEVENLHFDGLKLEFDGFKGMRLTTFAGLPVHLFETSESGDFLAGASIAFQPIKGSSIRLDSAYINDNNNDIGGNDDNLFAFSLRQNIKEWWNIFANFSMIGQTARDAGLRSQWVFPDKDLDINLSLKKQLSTLEDLTIELDDFNVITGDYFPYTEYSINAYKGVSKYLGIGLGFNIRRLNDSSNEGPFNHEFDNYYLTLSSHDFPIKGASISATINFYNTDDDETRSLGFNLREKVGDNLTLMLGTYYSLFKFDSLTQSERDNVRTFFFNPKYQITDRWEIELDYEFEMTDQESFHTVESGLKYRF